MENKCKCEVESECPWNSVPDVVILQIFKYLQLKDLLNAGLVCRAWNRVSYDEHLWKSLFHNNLKVDRGTPLAPGKHSWYEEYKRLVYSIPSVCTEILSDHTNEVLHVSCSHDGTLFATSSKDGLIIVWNLTEPVSIKYKLDMKVFYWKYTQFSQFNRSDTLLLVSGVHFGATESISGEIAVFSLKDEFKLQFRVINKPYDIFGAWFSDEHLLSGELSWHNHLESTTGLWINKASEGDRRSQTSREECVHIEVKPLYYFHNINASSVRRVMIANIPPPGTESNSVNKDVDGGTVETSLDSSKDNRNSENIEKTEKDLDSDKLLIFTTGSKTYTPHQIGLKRISKSKCSYEEGQSSDETDGQTPEMRLRFHRRLLGNVDVRNVDSIDKSIDLDGHIIGIALSPDHRYLYVNSRCWPEGYKITNPLDPPPIASEIDIHVIDLTTFSKVGKLLRSHKAYTPNQECFFIFLDVSDDYVASGAEDKFGYIWDRYYGICLAKYPHGDVVNCVALSPVDSSVLITTSDDYLIKVWRSRQYLASHPDRFKNLDSAIIQVPR